MRKRCKKCGHERLETDDTPDYECPKCGAVYAKVEAGQKIEAEQLLRQKEGEEKDRQEFLLHRNKQEERERRNQLICPNCGTIGKPETVTKGNILIEIGLWLLFLIPGVIYSIWRLTTRTKACRSCGVENMVPLSSPMGIKLQNEFSQSA